MAVQHFKVFIIDLFLNLLNQPIPLHFIHPKIRITNLDNTRLLIHCCVHVDFLQIWISSHFIKFISKTLQYSKVKVSLETLTKNLMRGIQNGRSYVYTITSSQDMHFKFIKWVMSREVSFMKFQKWEQNL